MLLKPSLRIFRDSDVETRSRRGPEDVDVIRLVRNYRDERKIVGLRGLASVKSRLAVLVDSFGARTLRSLTYADLLRYKEMRLHVPTVRRGTRAIATVHRELELLRRILTVGVREGWLQQNPFFAGDLLISKADEKQRERILTIDEERRLLAAAERPGREHLRPILICAIDTGMRAGELLKLRWAEVDLFARTIFIRASNTKTLQARSVHMTERVHDELCRLSRTANDGGLVFGISSNVKRSFTSARREAGLEGLRFHDLRHTAATRQSSMNSMPRSKNRIRSRTDSPWPSRGGVGATVHVSNAMSRSSA